MKPGRSWFALIVLAWLAGGCQQGLAPYIRVWGASPDFPVIALALLAMSATPLRAAFFGFVLAIVQGGAAGADLAGYTFAFVVSGYLIGLVATLDFEPSVALASLFSVSATIVAHLLLMFVNHQGPVFSYIAGTLGSAVYDGVIAAMLFLPVRRFLGPPAR